MVRYIHIGFETMWMIHVSVLKPLEELTHRQLYRLKYFGNGPGASGTISTMVLQPLSNFTQWFCCHWESSHLDIYTIWHCSTLTCQLQELHAHNSWRHDLRCAICPLLSWHASMLVLKVEGQCPLRSWNHWAASYNRSAAICRAHTLSTIPFEMLRLWAWSFKNSICMGVGILWMVQTTVLKPLDVFTYRQRYILQCFDIGSETSRTTFTLILKQLNLFAQGFCCQLKAPTF